MNQSFFQRARIAMLSALILVSLSQVAFADTTDTPNQPPGAQKEWTMLVFLNGHNSLDSFGPMNLKDMEKVGSSDKVNVVVQWASMNSNTKRMLIKKSTNPNAVTSPIVQELTPVDMGDANELVNFIKWGVQNYPAKHYFIDVWNHGSGWHEFTTSSVHAYDISFDDRTGHKITTPQLGQAMAQAAQIIGHKVDLYASDACLMSMIEVAQEMAASVDTFAGSEEVEPAKGWPYADLLADWNKLTDSSSQDVGKLLTKLYTASYQNGSNGTAGATFSAFDLNQLPALTSSLAALTNHLVASGSNFASAGKLAVESSTQFTFNDYVDLGDFLNQLKTRMGAQLDEISVRAVQDQLHKTVIANAVTNQFQRAQGLAIWLPGDSYTYGNFAQQYQALQFDKLTGWHAIAEMVSQ
jgi:hypothetical protein